MGKLFESITGAELLRADFCSQKIFVSRESGSSEPLVSEDQFWGGTSPEKEILFYDFKENSNNGWTVAQSGWNDYTQDVSMHMNSTQTEEWIKQNTLCENDSTITIIQGYAGCGKTVFVNSLLRKAEEHGANIVHKDVYVDYDNNSLEDGYLALSIRNHLIEQLIHCLEKDNGYELFEKYRDMLTKYGNDRSASFSNVLSIFREGGQISVFAKQVFTSRNDPESVKKREKEFARQFISATVAMTGALKYKFREGKEKHPNFQTLLGIGSFTNELLKIYAAMDFILLCTICENGNKSRAIVFYDNLDIIDNPYCVKVFVSELSLILSKIKMTFNPPEYKVPVINVIVAVRKITYSVMSSFLEVGQSEYNLTAIIPKFLDISNLYSPIKILKHKATTINNNLDSFIPPEHQSEKIKTFLEAMIRIPESTLDSIGLSSLFNHNIRACANVLERAMKYSDDIVPKDINVRNMTDRCSYAIWIHNICAVLNERDIWKDLGFNTENGTIEFYPAALSRLILTYLYNQRRGFSLGTDGYSSVQVSFGEIVQTFEKLPFAQRPYPNMGRARLQSEVSKNYSLNTSRTIIVDVIANMLKRNTRSDGINPRDEMELWRRPIYYTTNAFPLTDSLGNDNIKRALKNQLAQINDQNAQLTSFCITDEGYEFIERIVTNFEFFSIRFLGKKTKPLCYILNDDQLERTINAVHKQVAECINDHLWMKDFYIEHYGKSKGNRDHPDYQKDVNEYLKKEFHPRTDRFNPQLHIVRTIFDHIYTLNDYRDYLIRERPENFEQLNKTLLISIGKYLELYRANLFDVLEGTVGSFNDTFLDLKYLYWRIYKEKGKTLLPKDDENKLFISVNRTSHPKYRLTSINKISDEELKTDPMLLS